MDNSDPPQDETKDLKKPPSIALLVGTLPPANEEEFAAEYQRQMFLFGESIKSREQMEYFAMLPINDTEKRKLISKMAEQKAPETQGVSKPTRPREQGAAETLEAPRHSFRHHRRPVSCSYLPPCEADVDDESSNAGC